ncbi:YSIRK-type signal peptide-containing protein [Modicisalibacter tunisiensis]|uniref:YSIRK-type signal peptide-containing protein n=1 Tax=Modicisalibacter tunisiensis TaxID=390637 RepID=A0ABS7WWT3_9GAMM|nr:YSIRK-type signal peptide-containing protein [Modicisalibacter tunisiensis]
MPSRKRQRCERSFIRKLAVGATSVAMHPPPSRRWRG